MDNFKEEKILLTGGAGFIGSQVAQAYLLAGHKVIIIDDFSRGKRGNLPEGVIVYQVDICNLDKLCEIFIREQPTIVNHHAALVSVRESCQHPELYWQVNLQGTVNVIEAASTVGVKKLIYASSGGAIYGNAKAMPIRESASAEPISPYGKNKLAAEKVLLSRDGNMKTVVLRYANVYGPGQDALNNNGVITIFSNNMLRGNQSFIYGDGRQTRDFIHVRDVVNANLVVLKPRVRGIFNIGTGIGQPLIDVYLWIARLLKVAKMPIFLPGNPYEVKHNVLSVQRAREKLEWQPCVPFDRGLWETLQAIETDIHASA